MVLRSLSLSDEDGGPVQTVGLGDGVGRSSCGSSPFSRESAEPARPSPPVSEPQLPMAVHSTPPSTAMITIRAIRAKNRRRRYTRALLARRVRRRWDGRGVWSGLSMVRECSKRPGGLTPGRRAARSGRRQPRTGRRRASASSSI